MRSAGSPRGARGGARGAWWAVARKDIIAELRARETIVPLLLLALLVAVVGLLAFHDVEDHAVVASAIVWTSLAFAAALGLARAFGSERDRGTLDTLLALPIDRAALFFGKATASLLALLVTALVVAPVYWIASGDAWCHASSSSAAACGGDAAPAPAFALFLALGAIGLATVGTMLSAIAAQARTRDLLMPVLLFPLLVPILIAGVHGTQDVLHGEPFSEWRPELMLLAGYDLAFAAVGALLFEQAVDP